MEDILELNVGGRVFVTTRATLCAEQGSMLATMFDPDSSFASPKELRGAIFIDRDPRSFEFILDYLRRGCRLVSKIPDYLVDYLKDDADYFGLVALKQVCANYQPHKKEEGTKKMNYKIVHLYDANDLVEDSNWEYHESIPQYKMKGSPLNPKVVLRKME
eukprot:9752977-Ditylum_brightwellii.AAC.1